MVKRSARASFMPNAYVFPGGRVDPDDADAPVVGGASDRARMGDTYGAPAAAYQVAAVRETYEESGVLLASGDPDEATRVDLQDRRVTWAQAAARHGWQVDASALVHWSWWITPEVEPKRYDTRFFLAHVPRDTDATHDRKETVASGWFTVRACLERFDAGEMVLAPPTWRTLWELRGFQSASQALAHGRTRRVVPIEPRGMRIPGGIAILLPGDPAFPSDDPVDGPTRIELLQGRWFIRN